MKRWLLFSLMGLSSVIFAGRAYAHHSFAATYFEDKTEKVEGNLAQFLFRNPYSFIQVESEDEKGQIAALGCGMGRRRATGASRPHARHTQARRPCCHCGKSWPQSGRSQDAHSEHYSPIGRLEVGRKHRIEFACSARTRKYQSDTMNAAESVPATGEKK